MYLASDALVSPVTMEPSAPHSAAASASCPSPRTPPTSANRRLVRPLLLQRKNTIQQVSQGKASGQGGQVSGRPLAVSARYPDEVVALDVSQPVARGASSALATPNEPDGITAPTDVSTAAATREDSRTSKGGAAAETVTTSSPTIANQSSVNVSEGEVPAVHCPPLCSSHAAAPFLRATQPPIKRISAARPRPLLLPRTDTPMSLASYPSNLSSGARANSSADSSFAGISSVSKPGGPVDGAVTAAKPSTPSTHLSGRQTNEIAGERHAVPPLLRSSFSTNTLQDDANPSSASSYAARAPTNGSPSPRLRVGGPVPPYLPSSATSVTSGAATPLSSTRSSGRPSFLRTILPSPLVASAPAPTAAASSSGGGTTSAHEAHTLTTKDVAPRAVNGRVLSSPHGARRPELGPRRTTFGRSASVASLTDGTAPIAAATPSAAADVVVAGAGERTSGGDGVQETANGDDSSAAAVAAAEPAMSREMRSFVLGQYRTLQREVRTLPTVAEKSGPTAQVDVSAADFVHVKRCTCPRHSKAARRAEIKRQEEERLRAVQQQHHDMAVIRNGGREQVGTNMKSSTMLAGSLSKLRSRNKGSGQSGSADRIRSSLDRTISLAFESEESPFGSPEEVETTKLYGVSPFPSSTLEERASPAHQQQPQVESEPPAVSAQTAGTEAWHASRFFMAVPAASQERRSSRTVNKNGMKGEAIVVAVVLDSDEDDEESSASEAETGRGGRLRRTKGVASGTRASSAASRQTAVPPTEVREVTTSAAVVAGATKRSGADNDNCSSSSSSDDDACFSFNKLRTQRLRSSMTQSLSFSQTLDQKSLSTMLPLAAPQSTAQSPERALHRPGKMLSPSKVSSSSSSDTEDDEDVDPDACCVCCPCKKPENFFALCRTGSRSGSFVKPEPKLREPRQDGGSSPLYDPRAEKAAPHAQSSAGVNTAVPLRASADVNAVFDSRVELEDLETMHDDDEPLLSMQSFRRTSIQRVR